MATRNPVNSPVGVGSEHPTIFTTGLLASSQTVVGLRISFSIIAVLRGLNSGPRKWEEYGKIGQKHLKSRQPWFPTVQRFPEFSDLDDVLLVALVEGRMFFFGPRQQEMLEAGDIVKSSEAKLYPKQLGSIDFGEAKSMWLLSEEGFT